MEEKFLLLPEENAIGINTLNQTPRDHSCGQKAV
jgi:hypothetical protein